ncbi:MAG: serine/threonine-protein kinase [Phycisphaerae bacterium]|nr:serine/threonine protein kinase [Phycisphaerae bacterium]MCZ2399732.1 serine/threonine-protein kinase [Phycisphaerae bacterium]NUQ49909.1 serine/threonine protein kinase [Phycisphaerae bacterium]
MTPSWSHAQIKRIFLGACALPTEQRETFLLRECGQDKSLLYEVRSFLEHDQVLGDSSGASELLETPSGPLAPAAASPGPPGSRRTPSALLPSRIGSYRILGLLGEGGMATVYRAEQDKPRRSVALKVLKLSFASPVGLSRFELEAELLGRLRHPCIAQVYEAATAPTPAGPQPYFAMELVDGPSLTDFARERHLTTRERVALLAMVCDAVHHAHQQGVIHRDLKPSNILVVEAAEAEQAGTALAAPQSHVPSSVLPRAAAQPKVLDFGVARAVSANGQAASVHTSAGQIIGTVPYMSPEQVAGDPAELDIRSDVHALGVIGYELLTGRMPYELDGLSLTEALDVIRQRPPILPRRIVPGLRGDLEMILLKALEKPKARRYAAASELAADLRRHLNSEPVSARPPRVTYLAARFAQRHKALVAGLAATLLALLLGGVLTNWQARVALQERDRAVRESEKAHEVQRFLERIFRAVDLDRKNPDIRVRDVLAAALEELRHGSPADPDVRAALFQAIGRAYLDLGLDADAREAFEQAVELRRGLPADRSLELADSLLHLALAAGLEPGQRARAVAWCEEALAIRTARLGETHALVVSARRYRAQLLWMQGDHARTWSAIVDLAAPLLTEIEPADYPPLREPLERARELALQSDRESLGTFLWSYRVQVSQALRRAWTEGRQEAAVELVLAHCAPLLDRAPVRPMVPLMLCTAAGWLQGEGDGPDVIEPVLRAAERIGRDMYGEESFWAADARARLGHVAFERGDLDGAEQQWRGAIEMFRRVAAEDHPAIATAQAYLGDVLVARGDWPAAEVQYRDALARFERAEALAEAGVAVARSGLADALVSAGQFADAEAVLLECFERLRKTPGLRHPATKRTMARLERLYRLWGKPDQADLYQDTALMEGE